MTFNISNKFARICIGIVLYEAVTYISIFYGYSPIILNMLTAFIFLQAFFSIPKENIGKYDSGFKFLVFLTILMLLRGSLIGNYLPEYGSGKFDSSIYSIFRHIFFDHYVFAYLMPLVVMIPIRYIDLKICKSYGFWLCILSILLALYHLPQLIMASTWSARQLILGESEYGIRQLTNSIFIGVGFTLFMSYVFQYADGRKKWIYPITLCVFFLCTVAGAGRGSSAMQLLYLVFFFVIWLKYPINGNRIKTSKFKIVVIFILFIALLYYLINSTNYFDFLFNRLFEDDSTSTLAQSGREDYSRELYADFDDNYFYWLLGKGINGAYRTAEDGGYLRNTIEWGYLHLILKGGILYLITYCWVLLKAFYKGFYKSNNLVCKAFAAMCLFRVIALIPFGLPSISIECFLVWIGYKVIHTDMLRNMTDNEIKAYFGL